MSAADDGLARTWDDLPISSETPYGATIVVYRMIGQQREYLLLHNGHDTPNETNDWIWGAPSGSRWPGETIDACAARELFEETGLRLLLQPGPELSAPDWVAYTAEAPADALVTLSEEHDRFEWLPLAEACERIAPEVVREGFRRAVASLPGTL